MKIFAFALSLALLTATQAQARETLLVDVVKPFQKRYTSVGRDNNTISATYHDSQFRTPKEALLDALDFFGISSKQVQPLKNATAIRRALANCVFYPKGAYGPHISREQSEVLATSLHKNLEQQMILTPEIYLVNRVPVDIVGSGCGVVLFSTLNNEFVFLTAEGHD